MYDFLFAIYVESILKRNNDEKIFTIMEYQLLHIDIIKIIKNF